jgi:hypothetical protein
MAQRTCPTCGNAYKAPKRTPPAIIVDRGVTYAVLRGPLLHTSRILHECRPEPPRRHGDASGQPAKPKTPRPSSSFSAMVDSPSTG